MSCSRVLHQTFIIYVINIQLKFDILCNFSIQLIKCPPCLSGVTHFSVTSANCRPPHIAHSTSHIECCTSHIHRSCLCTLINTTIKYKRSTTPRGAWTINLTDTHADFAAARVVIFDLQLQFTHFPKEEAQKREQEQDLEMGLEARSPPMW